jgi:HSP20 family protein
MKIMSDENEKNKKMKLLYGIIAVLVLLLVFQAGMLFQFHVAKSKQKDARPEITHQAFEPPNAMLRPKNRPAMMLPARPSYAYDPFMDDFFSGLGQMRSRMNQLADVLSTYSTPMAGALGRREPFDFSPAIDLKETDNAYIVTSDLPGLEKEKINVSVRDNLLTIQGIRQSGSETEDQKTGYYAQERSYGSFARSVNLPGPVDEANIKAEYRDGVLTVTIPKIAGEKKLQKVAIQ